MPFIYISGDKLITERLKFKPIILQNFIHQMPEDGSNIKFPLLLGRLRLFQLVIESFCVVFVNIKAMLLSQKAVGCHFEQPQRLLFVLTHIGRESLEIMGMRFDEACNLIGDAVDFVFPVGLSLDCFEFYWFDLPDDKIVDAHKFVNDRTMFQFQHDFNKLPEFEHVFAQIRLGVEQFTQMVIL